MSIDRLAVLGLQPAAGLQKRLGVEVGKHEATAVARQPFGNSQADAFGRAGDDGDPPVMRRAAHRMMLTRPCARRPSVSSRQRFSRIRSLPAPVVRRFTSVS